MSRKLDAALAEALGYEVVWIADMPWQVRNKKAYPPTHYSTDGRAMLELDKEMRGRGFVFWVSSHIDGAYKFAAEYFHPENPPREEDGNLRERMTFANEEPLVRAKAAYHALTGKEWTE